MGEAFDRFVKAPGPAHDRAQLYFCEHLDVAVDDAAWQVCPYLARCPWPGGSADRFTDPPSATHIAGESLALTVW